MRSSGIEARLYDTDAERYIEDLLDFLGRAEVEKALKQYSLGKRSNKRRPIYSLYYYTRRHPWYEPLLRYKILKSRHGKVPVRLIRGPLENLAADAYMIALLRERTKFPPNIIKKLRKDLIREENTNPYIFELRMALHHLMGGGEVEWVASNTTMPEFIVRRADYSFQVECKYIRFDTGKNFRRRDFYMLADILLTNLSKMGLTGEVHIDFNGSLPGGNKELTDLSREILQAARVNRESLTLADGAGEVRLELRPGSDIILPATAYQAELNARKPEDSIAAVWSAAAGQTSTGIIFRNPVSLTFRNTQPVQILSKILEVMKDAKKQMSEDLPGVITVYLEGFNKGDLATLNDRIEFQSFNRAFFDEQGPGNVAAVCYAIGPYMTEVFSGEHISMDGLEYQNPGGQNKPPEDFKFLSPPRS
jgi:hypothetical protein